MVYEVKTQRSMDEVAKALEESAAENKFGVLTVHNLQQTMQKKGVEMDRQVRIFEVCNPHQASAPSKPIRASRPRCRAASPSTRRMAG
ncbi:MAG: DUF302 domain-containing protein [Bryobacterales bacterium]